MTTCLRMSEAVALALHTVAVIAIKPDNPATNQEIAANLHVSEHHLAKVHQRLVHAGLLVAARGPSGGFKLAKPAKEITLLQVLETVDGPFAPSQCLLGRQVCERKNCILGGLTDSINQQVQAFFASTTVDQLVEEG